MADLNNLPIMRIPKQAYQIIKENDPQTSLTLFGLETLIKSGAVPGVVKVGRKKLVNMQQLELFLKGDIKQPQTNNVLPYGSIRKVN